MGIYINGVDMPERCEDCFCYRHNAEYDYSYCNISAVNVRVHGQKRLNNCPLVPVPKHGDLIERDALSIAVLNCGYYDNADVDVIWELVQDAPTIIEAEEGE